MTVYIASYYNDLGARQLLGVYSDLERAYRDLFETVCKLDTFIDTLCDDVEYYGEAEFSNRYFDDYDYFLNCYCNYDYSYEVITQDVI